MPRTPGSNQRLVPPPLAFSCSQAGDPPGFRGRTPLMQGSENNSPGFDFSKCHRHGSRRLGCSFCASQKAPTCTPANLAHAPKSRGGDAVGSNSHHCWSHNPILWPTTSPYHHIYPLCGGFVPSISWNAILSVLKLFINSCQGPVGRTYHTQFIPGFRTPTLLPEAATHRNAPAASARQSFPDKEKPMR